ncbi:hypothetical protein [Corynebacterium hiratae]|uniref:Uncharacterized protein n=1 Tax=Corynebacterium hiratae TaxID=3139423 RepID=A0A553FYS1_9CORY|nr:hypothetical protein [Corynebacterium aurimucosum]TRX62399.1 hypothetical protein FNY97_05360 [Corynebacterium aurimucosum]
MLFARFVAGYMRQIRSVDVFCEVQALCATEHKITALIEAVNVPADMAQLFGQDVADVMNGDALPADLFDAYGWDAPNREHAIELVANVAETIRLYR